jgi:hypothetical protein
VRLASLVFRASVMLLSFLIGDNSIAGVAQEQVCDGAAAEVLSRELVRYREGVLHFGVIARRHRFVTESQLGSAIRTANCITRSRRVTST